MSKVFYTASACEVANTPELRDAVEEKTDKALSDVIVNGSMQMTTFEHNGQLYIILPSNEKGCFVCDTAKFKTFNLDLYEDHPFYGKELKIPVPDTIEWEKLSNELIEAIKNPDKSELVNETIDITKH